MSAPGPSQVRGESLGHLPAELGDGRGVGLDRVLALAPAAAAVFDPVGEHHHRGEQPEQHVAGIADEHGHPDRQRDRRQHRQEREPPALADLLAPLGHRQRRRRRFGRGPGWAVERRGPVDALGQRLADRLGAVHRAQLEGAVGDREHARPPRRHALHRLAVELGAGRGDLGRAVRADVEGDPHRVDSAGGELVDVDLAARSDAVAPGRERPGAPGGGAGDGDQGHRRLIRLGVVGCHDIDDGAVEQSCDLERRHRGNGATVDEHERRCRPAGGPLDEVAERDVLAVLGDGDLGLADGVADDDVHARRPRVRPLPRRARQIAWRRGRRPTAGPRRTR